jgi:hypothetical protein
MINSGKEWDWMDKNNPLEYFIANYYPEISQLIERQQTTYNLARIHSHRHISRCIIYSDWYCNMLGINGAIQRIKIYLAIAFHDIGRMGELEDLWENQSYEIYVNYIFNSLKVPKHIAENNRDLIIDKYEKTTINDIIHDVDCLDIMRLGTGRGGIMGFDKKYLRLFVDSIHIQEQFQNNAWNLICLTDSINFDNTDCLQNIYSKNKDIWKIAV